MPSIDERVVRMQFDNAQFEKGVSTSMKSINKLEEQLKFKGATDGLSNVQRAIDSFNISSMANAVDSIKNRFSTLGIVGMRITEKITDSMVAAAGKMVSGIKGVFSQIKEGGLSRALNLEQARFMLRGLLNDDLKKVERILNGPVLKAVKNTRFGLDEAAVAASNLYASGITNNKELLKSLRTISGVASMTNREYGDIADVFATVKSNGFLMTQQVRQFASMGLPLQAELAKYLNVAEAEIPGMLKEHEITYDKMVDTLYHYWNVAAKANETYSGALANVKAALSRIGAEVQAPKLEAFRKIFVALIPVIDKFNEELKPVYAIINGIIDSFSKATVKFLESKGAIKMVSRLVKSSINVWNAFTEVLKPVGEAFKEVFPQSFSKTVRILVREFYALTKQLGITGETSANIKNIFLGIFSTLKGTGERIAAVITAISPLIRVLGDLGRVALRVFGTIGESLFNFNTDLSKSGTIADLATKIADALNSILPTSEQIEAWGDRIVGTLKRVLPSFDQVVKIIETAKVKINDFIKNFKAIAKEHIDFEWLNEFSGLIDGVKQRIEDLRGDHSALTGVLSSIKKSLDTFVAFVMEVGSTVGKLLKPIFDNIRNIITNFTKDNDLNTSLKIINSGLFTGLIILIEKLAGTLLTDTKRFTKIGDQIRELFYGVTIYVKAMTRQINVVTLQMIATAIATLAASAFALSLVDPKRVSAAMTALGVGFIGLWKAMKGMDKLSTAENMLNTKAINAMARSMILIGIALQVMAKAVRIIGKVEPDRLIGAMVAFTFVAGEMVGMLAAMNKFIKRENPADLITMAGAMVIMSVAVRIMAGAFKAFSKAADDWDKIGRTLVAMGGAIAEMVAAFRLLAPIEQNMIPMATAMLIMAVSIRILANAFKAFSGIDFESFKQGMLSMGGALLEVIGAFKLMSMIESDAGFIKIATSIGVFAIALNILAAAFSKFAGMDMETIGRGLAGMGVALLEVIGSFKLLSGMQDGLVKSAFSVGILAIALNILASAFRKFAELNLAEIGNGLLGMMGALANAIGTIYLLDKIGGKGIAKLAGSLLLLAVGIKVLADAFLKFASVDYNELGIGLAAMATSLLTALGALKLLTMIGEDLIVAAGALTILSIGILVLANAMQVFGAMDFGSMMTSLIALGGSLLIIVGIIYSLTGAIPTLAALAGSISAIGIAFLAAGAGIALAGVGFRLLAAGVEVMSKCDILGVAGGVTALAGSLALLLVPGLAMAPVAPILLVLAGAIALIAGTASIAGNGVKNIASSLSLLQHLDVSKVSDTLDSLRRAFENFAVIGKKIEPLTDFMQSTGSAIDTLYSKLTPVTIGFVDFRIAIKEAAENLSDVSFDTLESEFKELSKAIEDNSQYTTPIRNLADSFSRLEEAGYNIAPITSKMVDMAYSMKTLYDITPDTATKITDFCNTIAALKGSLDDVSFAKIEEEISLLYDNTNVLAEQSDKVDAFASAFGRLNEVDTLIQPLSGHFDILSTAIESLDSHTGDVNDKFNKLADDSESISTNLNAFDITSFIDTLKSLKDKLDGVIGVVPDLQGLYQAFYDLGGTDTDLRLLSDHLVSMSGALTGIKDKLPEVINKINGLANAVSGRIDELNSLSFETLIGELGLLYGALDDYYQRYDILTEILSSIQKIGEQHVALDPLAESFRVITNSIVSIKNLGSQATGALQSIADNAVTIKESIALVDFSTVISQLETISTDTGTLVGYHDTLIETINAFFGFSDAANAIAGAANYIKEIASAMGGLDVTIPSVSTHIDAFKQKVVNLSNDLNGVSFDTVVNAFGTLETAIDESTKVNTQIQALIDMFAALGDEAIKMESMADHIRTISSSLVSIKNVSSQAKGALSGFADEMLKLSGVLDGQLDFSDIASKFADFSAEVEADATKTENAIDQLVDSFVLAFVTQLPENRQLALDAIDAEVSEYAKRFDYLRGQLSMVGQNAIEGLILGMGHLKQRVWDKAYEIGLEAKKGAMAALDEHSPSKVFYKIGSWAIEGFINGVDDKTKAAQKSMLKIMKSVTKAAADTSMAFDENSAMAKALEALEKARSEVAGALKNLKATKDSLRMVNKELKNYVAMQTKSKSLSVNQKAELIYLQKKLKAEGQLSTIETRRLATLLGLNKKESESLKNTMKQRKELTKTLAENRAEYQKLKGYAAEIEKEVFNHKPGDAMAFGNLADMATDAKAALEAYGKELYKNSEAYKEDQKNLAIAKALKKEEKASIEANRKARAEERKEIEKNHKTLFNLLNGKKTSIKLSKSEQKELDALQKKLQKRGKLTDEEYIKMAKLLGIKGDNLANIKAEILAIQDHNSKISTYNDKISKSKDNLTDINAEIRNLRDITPEAAEKLMEFYNTIKDNVANALEPFKTSLRDTLDLFSGFSTTTVSVSLPFKISTSEDDKAKAEAIGKLYAKNFSAAVIEQLKGEDIETINHYLAMSMEEVAEVNKYVNDQLIGNIASFSNAYFEYKKVMDDLKIKGFSDAILQNLRDLGPAGLQLAKMYATFTEEQITAANEAMVVNTVATVEEWCDRWEDQFAKEAQFKENIEKLYAIFGSDDSLDTKVIDYLASQGADAGGAFAEGLLSGSDALRQRVNDDYLKSLNIPDQYASELTTTAATAAQGVGNAYFDSLLKSFGNVKINEDDLKAAKEAVSKFTGYITTTLYTSAKDQSQEAGTQTGSVYIDGMSYAIDDNGYLVTDAASDVAEDAKKGTEQYLSKANGEYIGKQMDNGLISGLYAYGGAVAAAARAVAAAAYAAAMAELDIQSPSRKFAEIGMYADLGFAQGLSAYAGAVTEATQGVASGSLDSMREALAGISDELTNADNTPVIKPILDLSNVSRGAIEMKRMFDATHVAASMTSEGEAGEDADETKSGSNYTFVQNNYSPKALSRIDIYRQTKNQFAMLKGATS